MHTVRPKKKEYCIWKATAIASNSRFELIYCSIWPWPGSMTRCGEINDGNIKWCLLRIICILYHSRLPRILCIQDVHITYEYKIHICILHMNGCVCVEIILKCVRNNCLTRCKDRIVNVWWSIIVNLWIERRRKHIPFLCPIGDELQRNHIAQNIIEKKLVLSTNVQGKWGCRRR